LPCRVNQTVLTLARSRKEMDKPREARMQASYQGVAVAVPVSVPYVRYSTKGAHWFIARAIKALLDQSGLRKNDIDGLTISSFSLMPDTAVGVTQHLGMEPRFLEHIPMGGASGIVAMRRAARAVQAGDADIVACVGADTNAVDSFRLSLGSFSQFARDATYPYGSGGPNSMFAFITSHYMRHTGARREDFGKVCVAQRTNALKNPVALFKKALSLQEYMDARAVADPIHLFDCVMPCAGADAFLVMSEDRARSLKLPSVQILATAERHNAYAQDPIMVRGGWLMDQESLYRQASLGPEDVHFLQAYDDYPVIVMMQLEGMGFCKPGEGAGFVREHELHYQGSFPVNTSGGQLSVGQAGASGGFLNVVEAIRQLSGQAGDRQIPQAEVGAVSGFGMVTYDRCVCTSAAILASTQATQAQRAARLQ
jgi:acetyl-CoA acetyltransferase